MATNKKTAGANKPADKEKLTKAPEVEEVVQQEEPTADPIEEKPEVLEPKQEEQSPVDESEGRDQEQEQQEEPAADLVEVKPKTQDYSKTAAGLITKLRLNQVWRCPKTGYWFTREDYALAHAKSADSKLEIYKK